MAMGGDIRAGKSFVELYVKNNRFLKGLSAAGARLKSFGSTAMAVGGVVAGVGASMLVPLTAAVNQFVQVGSDLADMSARTKVSATTLAELGYAASQTGASLQDVEKAIRFAVSKGKGNDFEKLAKQVAAIEDPTKRMQAAMETFGKRSGAALLPMIENLAELRARAQALGIGPSDEDVKLADELGDKMDDVKASIMATVFAVGSALAPDLLVILETVIKVTAAVTRWVRDNKQIVVTIAKMAVGFVAAGAAIATIGAVIFGVGAVLGSIIPIVTAIVIAFKVAFIAIGAVIAMILSPIGLVVIALLLFTDVAKNVASLAGAAFAEIKDVALSAFGGIADALMSGNIMLAANILWTALKLLWAEGTGWLLNKWTDWKTSIAGVFIELVNGIKVIWNELQGFLSSALFATLANIINGIKAVLGPELFGQLDKALGGSLSNASTGIGVAATEAQTKVQERRDALAEELAGQMAALNDAADSEKGDRQKQIDLLRKQLDALNLQAAQGRSLTPDDRNYVPGGGAGDGMGAVGGVVGTFSAAGAAALGSMGGGGEERRDRKEHLKEARLTRAAIEKAERALAFAKSLGFI